MTKQSYKITKVGKIPEVWEVVRLGDAVEINRESRDPTRENPEGKFLYIDIESVVGGTGAIKSAKEIFGKDAPSRARRIIHQNDVIMSTVRPYLKAFALVPREYNNQICSTGFAVLSCKDEILPHYLLYTIFSKMVIDQCNKMMMGGQYPALNQSQVAKIEIPLPPLPEQRRIAEVLGTVDSAIQKVGGAIESTERLKKGMMQRLLTKGIGHERFKESEVGRIPEEWEVARLGDVGVLQDGDWILKEDYSDRGVRLLQVGDIGLGAFIDKSVRYISNERAKKLKCTFVNPDEDVLISRMPDPIGRGCLAPSLPYPYIVAVDVTIFRLKKETANPKFIIYSLNNPTVLKEVSKYASGATRQRISRTNLEQIQIPLPPLPEQRKIAEILSTVDKKLELERMRKEKLERVKKGMMNELQERKG